MIARASLLAFCLILSGCESSQSYDLRNPQTGKVVKCIAPAGSMLSSGQSNDPRPFQACIDACAPHGYEPVAPVPPGLEPEPGADKSQYIPAECR